VYRFILVIAFEQSYYSLIYVTKRQAINARRCNYLDFPNV